MVIGWLIVQFGYQNQIIDRCTYFFNKSNKILICILTSTPRTKTRLKENILQDFPIFSQVFGIVPPWMILSSTTFQTNDGIFVVLVVLDVTLSHHTNNTNFLIYA